jgi:prepilin-type processing-associated H-X9-DG protein
VYNYWLTGYSDPWQLWRGRKMADIQMPVSCLLLADGNNGVHACCGAEKRVALAEFCPVHSCAPPDPQLLIDRNARHNAGEDIAFCDGHVKWYRRDTILQNQSAWHKGQ